jgi:hypothetical protein
MLIHPDQVEFCKLWGDLVQRSWHDEALRQRLITDAAGVLKEYGYELPADANIALEVNESNEEIQYLYVPCRDELANPTAENAGVHATHCINNMVVFAKMDTALERAAHEEPVGTRPKTA